jgi:hypothetical protein
MDYDVTMTKATGNLSPQDIERVERALAAAKVKRKCLACGSTDVQTDNDMVGLAAGRHAATVGAEPTGSVMMCVARICRRCGYVMLHSVVALDLDSMM